MTEDEHRAMDLLAELTGVLSGIVANGHTRPADIRELNAHIHAIQAAVLSQAAGRQYPDRYWFMSLPEPVRARRKRWWRR